MLINCMTHLQIVKILEKLNENYCKVNAISEAIHPRISRVCPRPEEELEVGFDCDSDVFEELKSVIVSHP